MLFRSKRTAALARIFNSPAMLLSLSGRESVSLRPSVLLLALGLVACSSRTPGPESSPPGSTLEQSTAHAKLPGPVPSFPERGTGRLALPFHPSEQSARIPLPTGVQRVTSRGINLTFLLFDARNHRLSVADKAAGPDTEWPTAEAAAKAHGALAAINGSFFTPEGHPLGLVIEEGRHIGRWNSQSALTSGVVSVENKPRILRRQHWRSFSPTRHLLQAGPFLVENDSLVDGLDTQHSSPRSFLVWDGRSGWAFGHAGKATLSALGRALAAQPLPGFNITTALNLDGGRSSDLWVSPLVRGGPLTTRKPWNNPVRNYLLLHPHGEP